VAIEPGIVLHVADQVDHVFGGLANSIPQLCHALEDAGESLILASLDEIEGTPCSHHARRFPISRMRALRKLGWSPAMRRWIKRAVDSGGVNLVHVHSLWRMPNICAPFAATEAGVPCVVTPHGTLSEPQFRAGHPLKRVVWHLWQRRALERITVFHATSAGEARQIRDRGFRQPIAVIPLGFEPMPPSTAASRGVRDKVVLSLGRLDPIKGLDRLLDAWALIEASHPQWRLRIVGPDSGGHRSQLEAQARSLRLQHVQFEDGRRGPAKWEAMRTSSVFILPSHNENFGLALAEALSAELPVIASRGTPWAAAERMGCGWWVENSPELLANALDRALRTPEETLRAMGAKGSAWVRDEFAWKSAAIRLRELYGWILAGQPSADTPPFVMRC
jgi:glycosyltransferase involved in cell wall biosynthesis